MPTYQSRPLFDFVPNWETEPGQSVIDDVSAEEVNRGGIVVPWAEADRPQVPITLRFRLTRAQAKSLEDFQDSVRGRLQGFWLPSWAHDFQLQTDKGSAATTLEIDHVGLADLWDEWGDQYAHLCFHQADNVLLPLKASGIAAGTDAEVITLVGTLGATVAAGTRCSRLLYVRFADEELRLTWWSNEWADVSIRFIELPQEYASAELGTRPVWLYRVTRGSSEWLWAAHSIEVEASARTWTPAGITHTALVFDKEFIQGEAKLIIATSDANHPFRDYLSSPAIEPTHVQIFETTAPTFSLDMGTPYFEADLGSPKFGENGIIELKMTTPVGTGEWTVPGFTRQRLCNNQLYEVTTCKVAAAAFTTAGTISALGSSYVDATAFGARATAESDANWFALGDVSVGSETRMVLSQSGDRLTLNAPFLSAALGDSVVARRGCDLLRSTCKLVFSNLVNFGGYPDMPNTHPQLDAIQVPPQNVGKK